MAAGAGATEGKGCDDEEDSHGGGGDASAVPHVAEDTAARVGDVWSPLFFLYLFMRPHSSSMCECVGQGGHEG